MVLKTMLSIIASLALVTLILASTDVCEQMWCVVYAFMMASMIYFVKIIVKGNR